jgi:hypothetical protein
MVGTRWCGRATNARVHAAADGLYDDSRIDLEDLHRMLIIWAGECQDTAGPRPAGPPLSSEEEVESEEASVQRRRARWWPLPVTGTSDDIVNFFAPFDMSKDGAHRASRCVCVIANGRARMAGTLSAPELMEALSRIGEPLVEGDVQSLLGELQHAGLVDGDGRMVIRAFVDKLMDVNGS